jgi:CDP-glucose 4,6-dehydratase
LRLNIDKAVLELNWFPVLDGAAAIDWTVNWYKSWYSGDNDLQNLSLNQIHAYANASGKLVCK